MNNRVIFLSVCALLNGILLLTNCTSDPSSSSIDKVDQIVVRMKVEPETLNPMLASSAAARQIYQYMFLPLADYDYETLELKPVLLTRLPEGIEVTDGPWKGTVSYDMEIREEAHWRDNSPITGLDVLFTFKMASHFGIVSPGWKELIKDIAQIEVDGDNPKKFKMYSINNNFQSRDYLLSGEVYPRHIFDDNNVLSDISFADMKASESNEVLKSDSSFVSFGKTFSALNISTTLEGAGPYYLESVKKGQYIVLQEKENYWGDAHPDIDQLESLPDRIVFQIVNDETTALTLLRNKEIDVIDLSRASFALFDELKEDSLFNKSFDFFTPQIPKYLYMLMNNDDDRLGELPVRIAMNHLMDTERVIKQLTGGYAKRLNSIILSTKEEYNDNLGYRDYNIDKANEILEKAGWIDTNGDGVRDKIINGRRSELALRIHITGSGASTAIATILKESCSQAGIAIIPVIKKFSVTRIENFRPGDYELSLSIVSQPPVKNDPYLSFHSSSVGSGGINFIKYNSIEADHLIELIRTTEDEAVRLKAYMDFQQVMYDDAPLVFLYSAKLRVVASKNSTPVISEKNPGYFVNASVEL